jgi:hypothetical protein
MHKRILEQTYILIDEWSWERDRLLAERPDLNRKALDKRLPPGETAGRLAALRAEAPGILNLAR